MLKCYEKIIKEASEGKWITTRYGARVFIQDKGLTSEQNAKAEKKILADIVNTISDTKDDPKSMKDALFKVDKLLRTRIKYIEREHGV